MYFTKVFDSIDFGTKHAKNYIYKYMFWHKRKNEKEIRNLKWIICKFSNNFDLFKIITIIKRTNRVQCSEVWYLLISLYTFISEQLGSLTCLYCLRNQLALRRNVSSWLWMCIPFYLLKQYHLLLLD